jgi:hypothetical protein
MLALSWVCRVLGHAGQATRARLGLLGAGRDS